MAAAIIDPDKIPTYGLPFTPAPVPLTLEDVVNGRTVIHIPQHAGRDPGHPDAEEGSIHHMGATYVYVTFPKRSPHNPIACKLEELYWIPPVVEARPGMIVALEPGDHIAPETLTFAQALCDAMMEYDLCERKVREVLHERVVGGVTESGEYVLACKARDEAAARVWPIKAAWITAEETRTRIRQRIAREITGQPEPDASDDDIPF